MCLLLNQKLSLAIYGKTKGQFNHFYRRSKLKKTHPPNLKSIDMSDQVLHCKVLVMSSSWSCFVSIVYRENCNRKRELQITLRSCKCETMLNQDPWLWKMTAQLRLESLWSKSSHILNNVSIWTVESLNQNILEN